MRTIWILEQRRLSEKRALEASHVPASQEEEESEDMENEPPSSSAKSIGNCVGYLFKSCADIVI